MNEARPPVVLVRWVFLRGLGLVAFIAFVSIWVQIDGLLGSRGILPADVYRRSVVEALGSGWGTWLDYPSVFWVSASDVALDLACLGGVVASLCVTAGVFPRIALFACWALYLSICTFGRVFLAFQWDILLLEVLFVAIFFAPRGFRTNAEPSRASLVLLQLLLFKLVFSSGVVKLAHGDPTWRDLTALAYHYETQPLPTWIGWYAHQLPLGVHQLSVAVTFFLQLVVPFAIFAPRRVRAVACVLLAGEQVLIALTGNYCFFNILSLLLCLLLLDDAMLARVLPLRVRATPPQAPRRLRAIAGAVAISAVAFFQALQLARVASNRDLSNAADALLGAVAPFRTINGYGLFSMMTTERREIVLEGSEDGETWKAYELPHQPGNLYVRPGFVAPHQPRLDWQMWFAALGTVRQNPWFTAFARRLLEGEPEVLALLAHNPFPDRPPRFVRAELYDYRFTDPAERAETGRWWQRTYAGRYMAPMTR